LRLANQSFTYIIKAIPYQQDNYKYRTAAIWFSFRVGLGTNRIKGLKLRLKSHNKLSFRKIEYPTSI